MLVRLLEGRRAGEIADMPYKFAAPLIADGRVTVLADEPTDIEPVVALATASVKPSVQEQVPATVTDRPKQSSSITPLKRKF